MPSQPMIAAISRHPATAAVRNNIPKASRQAPGAAWCVLARNHGLGVPMQAPLAGTSRLIQAFLEGSQLVSVEMHLSAPGSIVLFLHAAASCAADGAII